MTDGDRTTDDGDGIDDVVTVEHTPDAVEEAGELVREVEVRLRELAGLDDGPAERERAAEIFEGFRDVADEAEDVLETINFGDLPDAVDVSELPDAVDAGDVPEAVAGGDPEDAVELRNLGELVELTDLWSAVDVREFWRNKREFDAAVADLFADDAEGANAETDDGHLDGASGFDGADESDDADAADASDDGTAPSKPELGLLETDESKQAAIQKAISDSVAEFRESILDARERLSDVVETNRDRTESVGRPNSRNPTAVSTMATSRPDLGGATRFSTVPEETRYSTAPNRPRVYGQRFEGASERTGTEDD
ncbi:hypothetical protein [Halorubrum sp. Eb13]|uniref:hypothetical protein n=1 Tax=Halorubrum sp. Eb13 TaxID=1383843 RepID=UPI000BD309C0|nr:hypothetical protein [Halorubrum sp. Eb13]OYR40999.1 hypothetical protein DJ75_14575 [Halorubrum sp. Eb13]